MILSASSSRLLQFIVDKLKLVFAIKDLGPLRYFLGIDVKRDNAGFFLSQEKYATEILDRAGMMFDPKLLITTTTSSTMRPGTEAWRGLSSTSR
jgi:hypothetical protein